MPQPRSILMVLTAHSELGATGRETGFNVDEAAYPWEVFRGAGYDVGFVAAAPGTPRPDSADMDDPAHRAFLDDPDVKAAIASPRLPADVEPGDYAAVFFVGGHGTMWDFPDNADLAAIAAAVYEAGGVVAAVCHGPAGLVGVELPDGRPLVEGKRLAAFTNEEEAAVGLDDVVPFLLQSRLVELGAEHVPAGKWEPNVVVDRRLVTGQNPASAKGTAEAVVKTLAD